MTLLFYILYIIYDGRSVGIVRLRTKGHGVCFLFFILFIIICDMVMMRTFALRGRKYWSAENI
jgi:hypothetical protein